jgi:hypothetical protein
VTHLSGPSEKWRYIAAHRGNYQKLKTVHTVVLGDFEKILEETYYVITNGHNYDDKILSNRTTFKNVDGDNAIKHTIIPSYYNKLYHHKAIAIKQRVCEGSIIKHKYQFTRFRIILLLLATFLEYCLFKLPGNNNAVVST